MSTLKLFRERYGTENMRTQLYNSTDHLRFRTLNIKHNIYEPS